MEKERNMKWKKGVIYRIFKEEKEKIRNTNE